MRPLGQHTGGRPDRYEQSPGRLLADYETRKPLVLPAPLLALPARNPWRTVGFFQQGLPALPWLRVGRLPTVLLNLWQRYQVLVAARCWQGTDGLSRSERQGQCRVGSRCGPDPALLRYYASAWPR